MEVQAFYVVPTDIALGRSLLLLVSNKVLTPTWPFLIYPGRGQECYVTEDGSLGSPPGLSLMWVGGATSVFLWC